MISLPNMLLIGAADRNVGKTQFACGLIKKYSSSSSYPLKPEFHPPVVAIKITVIKESGEKCPRGGQGCGVCQSLSDNFLITEELNPASSKDTSKMLAAGAGKVFWLRVVESYMAEGINALLNRINSSVISKPVIICESNSIRKVIEPGLFVVLKNTGNTYIKPSCTEVLHFADKIIYFNSSEKFSLDLEQFHLDNFEWSFRENATAIILAGGKGTRIGGDKGLLPVRGKAMVEHVTEQLVLNFDQILISLNDPSKYSFLKYKVIPDERIGEGPLMGILSCLECSNNELNFITACDIPDINMQLVRRMLREIGEHDVIVPITQREQIEPLFGIYRTSVKDIIREFLYNSAKRKVSDLFNCVKTKYLKVDDLSWYKNINTRDDYREYLNTLQNC